jgi:hypothetical protein
MPVEGPLPGTGDQHDINADANRCLTARMPRNWRLQSLEGTDDYGYDFQVQTTSNQQATDIFRVQLKGTRSPSITADEEYISITLKASTVRYYDRAVEPVLLVVCDLSVDPDPIDCPLYYAWTRDELNRINVAELPVDQKYVTLRVPTKNRLRSTTDLSNDILLQNELSRAGHDLSRSTEQTHPGMQADDRLTLVQGVVQGLAAKGPALMDALASSKDEHWVNPPHGSLAWNLSQARAELRVNGLNQAAAQLDEAESKLENCTDLELAEYWGLRGNWHVEARANQAAISAYKKAYQAKALPKYAAAWVEVEIRTRFENQKDSLSELHDQLEGDDPLIVATRSRLHAVQGNYDLALDIAGVLPEPDRSFATAFAHWLSGAPEKTLSDCEAGLAACDSSHESRSQLLLLRARAKFTLAVATASAERNDFIPPAGLPGVEPHKLEDAWLAICDAVAPLKAAGWDSNIELIVDIWAATASALGKGETVLQELIEATRTRPDLPNIHEALRSIAGQSSNFVLALSANDRLPDSRDKNIWATILLYEVGKFRLCWQHFRSCIDSLDRNHPMFGSAVIAASLAAHKSVQPELVKQWMDVLDAHPQLKDQAALAQFYLALEISRLAKNEALASLISSYDELNRPLSIALTLFREINPTDPKYALSCVRLSEQITEYQLLSPSMAARLGLALVTLEDWPALLELCQGKRVRVEPGDRMAAFEALALDHLGETEKARDRLLSIVAAGSYDQLALNTYVTIATRCGYVEDAIEAAERVFETAQSKRERFECVRLLYSLTQFNNPQSSRLLDLALRASDLVDQEVESQEGAYLLMHLGASLGGNDIDLARDREQFRARSDAFFKKFPKSRMLRKSEVREDSTAEELMESLRALTGITRDQEAFQSRLEYGLQQGFTVVPFSWRPRRALSSICDVVHLWEVAKVSSRDDRKYHLTMIAETGWTPFGAEVLRQRIPLLDWTALLVLYDLDMIGTAVNFFGKIAISKATLEELTEFTNPFFGSLYRERCLGLQKALKPHLASILQPSPSGEVSDAYSLGRSNTQIVEICAKEAARFKLYSDDFAYRVFCAGESEVDGFCTLDLLAALVEVGLLTPVEKARKMARLCKWRVGVVVPLLDILLLLPPSLQSTRTVSQGVQVLDAEPELVSVISAIWDYRLPFDHALEHAARVLRVLLGQASLSDIAVTSLLRQWYVKASLKKDAPPDSLQTITLLILFAALANDLPKPHVKRLWSIFTALVEAHHGDRMDEALEREAIRLLGRQCAALEAIEPGTGEVVHGVFNECLTQGTTEQASFSAAYTAARIASQREGARR